MSSLLSELFSKPREREDFLIALVVITLFGVFIFKYALPQKTQATETAIVLVEQETVHQHLTKITAGTEQRPSPRRVIIDTDLDAQEPKTVVVLPTKTNSAPPPPPIIKTEVEEAIIETNESATIETQVFEDAVTDTIVEETVEEGAEILSEETETTEAIYEPDPIEEEVAVEEEIIEEPAIEEVVEKVEEVATEQTANIEEFEERGESFDCLIIVGAFKVAENANVLIAQLKTAGYSSKKIDNRGFTCVGIPVVCSDQDNISSIMGTMKTKFKVEPWVMKN